MGKREKKEDSRFIALTVSTYGPPIVTVFRGRAVSYTREPAVFAEPSSHAGSIVAWPATCG